MNNITIGRYLPYDSFIHRLDPRLKLSALLILLVAIFFDAGFIGYALLGIVTAMIYSLSKLKLSYLLKSLKVMMFMIVFLMIINLFVIKTGNILITIGGFSIYDGAIFQTLYIVIRLVLIISLTTVLTTTTKPLDLTLGLEHLLSPFKKIGFPSSIVAMMISIALRFIPTLLDETQRIMKAQASRGVDFNEGKMKDKILSIVSLIVPLFISAFQRAEELANAMESRGYNPEAPRTRYKQLKWSKFDTLSLILALAVLITVIVLSVVV